MRSITQGPAIGVPGLLGLCTQGFGFRRFRVRGSGLRVLIWAYPRPPMSFLLVSVVVFRYGINVLYTTQKGTT